MMRFLSVLSLVSSFAVESPSVKDRLCSTPPPRVEDLCQLSKTECKNAFGSTCRETDLNRIVARLSDTDLQKKVFEKTKHFFEDLKRDDETTSRCCQNDEGCRQRLMRVSIKVTKSAPQVELAYFHLGSEDRGEIIFSDSRLLASNTFEDIENTLLHEWGHACQFARNPEADSMYCDEVYGSGHLTLAIATRDIRDLFDKNLEKCVRDVLLTLAEKSNEVSAKHCLSARGSEAFADLFLLKRVSLYGWERLCLAKKNESHEFPTNYLDCWIQNQRVRNEICEYKKASTKSSSEAVR